MKTTTNSDERRSKIQKRIRRYSGKPMLLSNPTGGDFTLSRDTERPQSENSKAMTPWVICPRVPYRPHPPSHVANRTSLVGRSATRNFQTACDMCCSLFLSGVSTPPTHRVDTLQRPWRHVFCVTLTRCRCTWHELDAHPRGGLVSC